MGLGIFFSFKLYIVTTAAIHFHTYCNYRFWHCQLICDKLIDLKAVRLLLLLMLLVVVVVVGSTCVKTARNERFNHCALGLPPPPTLDYPTSRKLPHL